MSQEFAYELRIYTGIHAGARAPLTTGCYVLGSSSACDFILCDQGIADRHAELQCDPEGWVLRGLAENGDIPTDGVRIPLRSGIAIGPVVVAIDETGSAWGEIPSVVQLKATVPDESPVASSKRREPSLKEPLLQEPNVSTPSAATDAFAVKNKWLPFLALSLTVCVVSLVLLVSMFHAGGATDSNVVAKCPEQTASDPASQEARALKVIEAMNLTQRTQLRRKDDGTLSIKAVLLTDEEYEQLGIALSEIKPQPLLEIMNEQDLLQEVRDILQAKEPDLNAEYLGNGRFRIQGKVSSNEVRNELQERLQGQLPMALSFENELMTPELFAERIREDLLKCEATDISSQWHENALEVSAKIPQSSLHRLKSALFDINERFGKWFSFTVRPTITDGGGATMPFAIAGVVGGPMPYIILPNRQKVLVGGSVNGWRLVQIDAHQIILDGPRRLVVNR